MFNERKFAYVGVAMDRGDEMILTLMRDLKEHCPHLYPVRGISRTEIVYKGLVPIEEARSLKTLVDASPYGTGYTRIIMDGRDIYDKRNMKRLFPYM